MVIKWRTTKGRIKLVITKCKIIKERVKKGKKLKDKTLKSKIKLKISNNKTINKSIIRIIKKNNILMKWMVWNIK